MVLCTGLLVGCDKDNDEYKPIKPPIERPDTPVISTDDIIKTRIGDINMIVGTKDWNAVVYGNGRYVAVGQSGYIAYSSDGVKWTTKQLGENFWNNVIYASGKFVAVGGYSDGGYVATSTDGVTWTTRKNITDAHIFGICYSGNLFVIVCHWGVSKDRGYILTSSDGVTWASKTTVGYSYGWNAVTYSNGKFVAVGDGEYGTSDNCGIAMSSNGSNWSIVNNFKKTWNAVTYGKGKFVAVGKYITTSSDGITWTTPKQIGTKTWNHIIISNGKFMAVGIGGYITTSIDGENWTTPEQLKDESGKVVTATLKGVCVMP